ncbi:hypothetical protein FRC08_005517 [Ceratobasidium sp. 394]|nr:hypothetical protein FRC08_005517 [Ceratobasidium sp. 394]
MSSSVQTQARIEHSNTELVNQVLNLLLDQKDSISNQAADCLGRIIKVVRVSQGDQIICRLTEQLGGTDINLRDKACLGIEKLALELPQDNVIAPRAIRKIVPVVLRCVNDSTPPGLILPGLLETGKRKPVRSPSILQIQVPVSGPPIAAAAQVQCMLSSCTMPAARTLFNGADFQIYRPNPTHLHSSKNHLSFSDKLKIIDYYHAHKARLTQQQVVTRIQAMGFPSITQSTLSSYLKAEDSIRAFVSTHPTRIHAKQLNPVKLPEVEEALYKWIMAKQNTRVCLTGALICEKAREFCRLLNVPENKIINFLSGWLTRLKARFGLRAYKFHGEAASAPVDILDTEVQRLTEIIQLYDPRDVFNADETALFFRLPPNQGLATHQLSGVKADKTRMTYLLCANMDGSEKREPLVIGHAWRPRCFGGSEASDLGFYYFWNKTAWMVQSIWEKFLSDLNADMVRQNRHILLLVDNAPSHRHSPNDYPNVRVEPLAPNLTAWIQPMDAGVIRCFKAHYRNGFTRLVLQRDNAGIEKIFHIDQLEAMRLASSAWTTVAPTTIANCWRHAGPGVPGGSPDPQAPPAPDLHQLYIPSSPSPPWRRLCDSSAHRCQPPLL